MIIKIAIRNPRVVKILYISARNENKNRKLGSTNIEPRQSCDIALNILGVDGSLKSPFVNAIFHQSVFSTYSTAISGETFQCNYYGNA